MHDSSLRSPDEVPQGALDRFDEEGLTEYIRTLASDEFEGRLPGTRGEELTINYLAEHFSRLGLQPGNPDGTFFQKIPLVGITADPDMTLTFSRGPTQRRLGYGSQFMGWTKRVVEDSAIRNSEVVFAGYGVEAPEFDWNDFKDLDLESKTLIVLVNDPPIPDPENPQQLDEDMFGGRAMTYYGRWTYKYEIAAAKGAAGCFIVHETGSAGYPWEVVSGSWRGEQFDLVTADKNLSRSAVEGWLTRDAAVEILRLAGQDFDALKEAALSRDFQPVALGLNASLSVKNSLRTIESNNVIARLDGSDSELQDEYVVYMAHWDHLGKDETLESDQIYNGARDNATGTAGLLELGEAFAALATPPRRSILFLAVTAEEQGLLGSRFYAENPLYPHVRTVAALNMDAMNIWGRTRDVTVVGMGNSTLDDVLEAEAETQGRTIRPDPEPEKGFYYRSDHFNFAKHGVPALYVDPGIDFIERPEGWGRERRDEYTTNDYHKPSDEYRSEWDLSGEVEDLRLLFRVGYRVANQDEYPEWKPGTEFKARREEMLREAGIER